jgi:hypothetical protein
MLQAFYMDVTKVDRDVAYVAMFERHVASVSGSCCKHLFKIFHLFADVCYKRFLSGCCTCFTHMLQEYVRMFQLFQSYVAISVLFRCCICFIHMLQVYVPNISFVLDLYCI